MDKLNNESKYLRRISKADKKVGNIEHRKVKIIGVTKREFHAILDKASQPINKNDKTK